jgi:AraC-like DNA-binding protein
MVENHLLAALPSGKVQTAVVARQLGMSHRSLMRHLAEEGATYGQILDGLRKRLAPRYLEDQRMSLQQIAWLLGYSELAAFDHAFKRWFGTTPGRSQRFALTWTAPSPPREGPESAHRRDPARTLRIVGSPIQSSRP